MTIHQTYRYFHIYTLDKKILKDTVSCVIHLTASVAHRYTGPRLIVYSPFQLLSYLGAYKLISLADTIHSVLTVHIWYIPHCHEPLTCFNQKRRAIATTTSSKANPIIVCLKMASGKSHGGLFV